MYRCPDCEDSDSFYTDFRLSVLIDGEGCAINIDVSEMVQDTDDIVQCAECGAEAEETEGETTKGETTWVKPTV